MAPSGIRKQPSGAEKRRRRKKIEEFVKSQSNAILKFIKKSEKSSSEDKEEIGQKEHVSEDMSDPANWRVVDTGLRYALVENGPVARLPSDYQFPKDALGGHFSHVLYIRVLANRETLDRRWLVYSKAFDKAFCFCCKLFRDDDRERDDLVTTGYNDWGNVSARFREHETSCDHIRCMVRWREMEIAQEEKKAVDVGGQSKVNNPVNLDECDEESDEEEKEHLSEDVSDPGNWGKVDIKWRDLLVRIGPTTRPSSDYRFPKDATGRRFSPALYVNGEKADRRWLVYSKVLDKAFCFSCKLLRDDDDRRNGGGNLATTGYNDWRNISTRLREHERCPHHNLATTRWKMLEMGLRKNQTIDKLIKL
ncbi:hypothetical protein Bca101_042495 [Brassica carinata]